MIELLVYILPLIFICSAIGIVLLNFPSIAAYLVYVFSMITQPKHLFESTQNEIEQNTKENEKTNIFTPFKRIATLVRVVFFPDIDLNTVIYSRPRSSTPSDEDIQSIYAQKTREEMATFSIKTYSAGVLDSNKFKLSYEPIEEKRVLSNDFKQSFPDLTKSLEENIEKESYNVQEELPKEEISESLPNLPKAQKPKFKIENGKFISVTNE